MSATLLEVPMQTTALPAIQLADLVAEADLQTRVDRKYLLPVGDVQPYVDALPAGTRVLEIDGRRSFGYASTYFDTADLRCYLDAARRRRHRFKVRTRRYLDSGLCRLEVKTRDCRRRTVKTAIDYAAEDCGRLTVPAIGHVASALERWHEPPALAPSLLTSYRRTTFVLPGSAARVTVDTDLVFRLPSGVAVAIDRWAVVETKAGQAASAADRLLWDGGHRPTTVSKYGTGLALLRPDLPANKWHRTIRTIKESTR